jgi:dihydrofolate reductase
MSKLVVTEFVTLDGVFQDPGGSGEFDRGGWSFKFNRGPEGDKFKLDELTAAGAMLLGRITYEGFAQAWPSVKDEAGFGDKMNNLPKYLVSTTLDHGTWNNTTVIRANVAEEVRKLKEAVEGDILIHGSGRLRELTHASQPDRRVSPDGVSHRAWSRQASLLGRERADLSTAGRQYEGRRRSHTHVSAAAVMRFAGRSFERL